MVDPVSSGHLISHEKQNGGTNVHLPSHAYTFRDVSPVRLEVSATDSSSVEESSTGRTRFAALGLPPVVNTPA